MQFIAPNKCSAELLEMLLGQVPAEVARESQKSEFDLLFLHWHLTI